MELENFKGDFLGITDNGNPDVEVFLANGQKEDIYSNFRMFGIGKQSEQQKAWQEKRRIAKEERHNHSFAERAENIAMKVPMAPVRAGFLAGLRLNVFALSRKLYPSILSDEDAKKGHYDLANRQKAIDALHKIEKLYFRIGGRSESIEKNIRVGFDRPIFNTKKVKQGHADHKSSFDADSWDYEKEEGAWSNVVGWDDAAYIASAAVPLATAAVKAASVKSNPHTEGSDEYKRAQPDSDAAKNGGYMNPETSPNDADIDKLIKEKGKILGMKPFVFYGIAAAAIIGLGILVVKSSKK